VSVMYFRVPVSQACCRICRIRKASQTTSYKNVE